MDLKAFYEFDVSEKHDMELPFTIPREIKRNRLQLPLLMKRTTFILLLCTASVRGDTKVVGVIGVKICGDTFLAIADVFDDMPAAKAGVRKGDFILRINNEDTTTFSFSEVISEIQGTPNTTVALTLRRASDGTIFDVVVPRVAITIENEQQPMAPRFAPH